MGGSIMIEPQKENNKYTAKASAYTPGLKVKRDFIVRKIRRLPIEGEILVNLGSKTDFNVIVARCEVAGDSIVVDASSELKIEAEDIERFMIKKEGDKVKKGEIIAQNISFFGLIKKYVKSPIDGTLERISELTGNLTLQAMPIPVEVESYIPGYIVKIHPKEGVEIETSATYIQGVIGIGGEAHGKLSMVVNSADEILSPEMITQKHKGKIIVGGSLLPIESIKKATEIGVVGIIAGGINYEELVDILGHELGVAITGHEEIGLTILITEGFGKMTMSQRVFNLCKEFNGYEAAINGQTQIRAGVIRPELIVPHDKPSINKKEQTEKLDFGMTIGTPIRIIREPYFGKIGFVKNLPVDLQKIETESNVRVVTVILENGNEITLPRANVEIIEE